MGKGLFYSFLFGRLQKCIRTLNIEEVIMSKTMDALQQAFAGESQANIRYLAFAKKAEEDGFPQIAKVFRVVAEAETIHAHYHLKLIGEIKSTTENVDVAIHGEAHEFKRMYPEMIETAQGENNSEAVKSFRYAKDVEQMHHSLFERALMYARDGKDVPMGDIYLCPVCGYAAEQSPPDKCKICGTAGSKFIKIE
jgi:rubrerythrin